MAYYDRIAKSWHEATGYKGGSFKAHVLNNILLEKIGWVSYRSILELGAGNGYFMRLALRYFSGQTPKRIVVSDQSPKMLSIAESRLNISGAEYKRLDVRAPFPFEDESFDLILATMIFNELSTGSVKRALAECHRVMRTGAMLLMTLTHPVFIASLSQRNLLRKNRRGILTMPGAKQMRLPIVPRSLRDYARLITERGFSLEATDVYATEKVLSDKPALRYVGQKPIALVLECSK